MKCFVIMPFGNPQVNNENASRLESIYSKWIKPAVESIQIPGTSNERISCHRGDKTFRPGEVLTHIIENLITSEIVIADLSGKNANVFYELGIRHSVGSNCILISDNVDDVPFDLRVLRTIIYKYEPDSMLILQESLKQSILEILQNLNAIDNPVRRYIFQMEVEKNLQKPSSPTSDFVKDLISEMSILRGEMAEQSSEVRKILSLITSNTENNLIKGSVNLDLASIQGIWVDKESKSRFYVRFVNGNLSIPYSYGGYDMLSAHISNYRIIDKTIFGRFEWFQSYLSGYIFLKIESNDEIEGGWWYEEDIPEEILKNFSIINDRLPRMTKLILKRVTTSTIFPAFIERYFKST